MPDVATPLDLDGADLGPVDVDVTADRIAFYVDATGDDPDRWLHEAPPGFASVLLFAVADLFLHDPDVAPYTATLIHVDQSFRYFAPMRAGSIVTVHGTITRVRERGGSYFVTFDATGQDGTRTVVESTSTFVLSDRVAGAPDDVRDEPPVHVKGTDAGTERSASRLDLVTYAAATRDFNPLHWDHDVAVRAGLPGTVVHGLLMYAWMVQAASAAAAGSTIESSTVRFRAALHPGEQAHIAAEVDGAQVALELRRDATALVTGTATVATDPE